MKLQTYAIMVLLAGLPPAGAADIKPLEITGLAAKAEHGDAEAQFQLGRAYLRGEGVPKDENKALALMKSAAEQGHADAMSGVGYFHDQGVAVPKDKKQALEWFRKGAEKGSAKAQLNLGKTLLSGKDLDSKEKDPACDEALQWIKKAADQGLPEACLSYARILFYGDYGVTKDPAATIGYLKPAAEAGIPDAENMMGAMYEAGTGVPLDAAAAKEWYRKSAMQGYVKAQRNLGLLLGPLAENKESRIEALAWLLMARDQEDTAARKALGDAELSLKKGELEQAKMRQEELRNLMKK